MNDNDMEADMVNRNDILHKIADIGYQPFLIFATQAEEKTDNTLETLRLLSEEENVTAGRISEYLDIRPSSVTQIINKLERAGMAARVKSEDDARITFVRLTDKGRESAEQGDSVIAALNEALFKGFSQQDLASFDSYLSRLQASIDGEEFQHKLFDLFGNDARWRRLSQMSSRFGRARAHMMRRSGFPDEGEAFRGGYGHRGGPRERGWR
ncbi:MarR family winged helix-turn-helix transcriptional regulator [Bifidobacterium tibiigranuli]|jgi:DNA-binding MarR family transcriptional regulator|nr:MarR family transcriptional regulator [Bifidobacterium tibiigranuli]MCI1673083.1 MarR family transcriptional regulator [Bifidobacterium tibiigranuli]MCI1713183.1 MarR family transcriptional regulator [Bifidobacterium tibiigranuli]MCI1834837.1 MarR family transcriptional regulator [Bifidobacterium tibiigranuli]